MFLVEDHPPGRPVDHPGSGFPSDSGKVLSQSDRESL